ncbi:hypothetical protein PF003_g929 [Phytophthora fragariae]|nr:hypothetical protein PF003_g929 [Phytophthora fragariae]
MASSPPPAVTPATHTLNALARRSQRQLLYVGVCSAVSPPRQQVPPAPV